MSLKPCWVFCFVSPGGRVSLTSSAADVKSEEAIRLGSDCWGCVALLTVRLHARELLNIRERRLTVLSLGLPLLDFLS